MCAMERAQVPLVQGEVNSCTPMRTSRCLGQEQPALRHVWVPGNLRGKHKRENSTESQEQGCQVPGTAALECVKVFVPLINEFLGVVQAIMLEETELSGLWEVMRC